MSKDELYLDKLLADRIFNFKKLEIVGIDNEPVFDYFGQHMTVEETCLFSREITSGQAYIDLLHSSLQDCLQSKKEMPVVRFADGEYAFYAQSMKCNGLYQQAESVGAIRRAIPYHVGMLRRLAEHGWLAPLVHQGNIAAPKRGLWAFLRRSKSEGTALQFLELMAGNEIALTADNYIPFYVLYAYLSSPVFAALVHYKHLCILNSTCNVEACKAWFARRGSEPRLTFVEIPDSFVATRWQEMRAEILARVPADCDLCLVGAGIGSLPVCVDLASTFAVPAIDAGHVLNMMNAREDKSNGARLYTIWK